MLHERGREQVAREFGMSGSALGYRARKMGLTTAKGSAPDHAPKTFTLTEIPESDWKPDALLKAHGLDPEEWQVVRVRGNRWGDPDEPNAQLRIDAVPLKPPFTLPTLENWKPLPKPKPRKGKGPKTTIILSDQHCPHIDPVAHRLVCEFIADEKPDLLELNGDLLDFSTISRHRQRDGYAQSVNECLQSAFNTLRDYRHAAPDAAIRLKRGNHCERIEHALIDNMKELHRITAADDDVPALSLRKLLHLDQLHIEYVDEEWDRAATKIGKRLTVRHGYATGQNVGGKMLTKLAGSNIQGHTHRASLTYRTHHTLSEEGDATETRLAAECPCLCQIEEGLGYINGSEADWQQGCLLVKTWPDEDFAVSPVIYLPGRLLTPDGRRYEA
jgi:hypothetical protein